MKILAIGTTCHTIHGSLLLPHKTPFPAILLLIFFSLPCLHFVSQSTGLIGTAAKEASVKEVASLQLSYIDRFLISTLRCTQVTQCWTQHKSSDPHTLHGTRLLNICSSCSATNHVVWLSIAMVFLKVTFVCNGVSGNGNACALWSENVRLASTLV